MKKPTKIMFPLEMTVVENGDVLLTQTVDGVSHDIAMCKEQAAILSNWLLQALGDEAGSTNASEAQHA